MPEPAPEGLSKRDLAVPAGCQIQRHVEAVAALPIAASGCIVEHVDFQGRRQSQQFHQRRTGLRGKQRLPLLVDHGDQAFLHHEPLRTKEDLGGPQHENIVAIVQQVSQDHLHQLIDQDVREFDLAPDNFEIAGFERAVLREMIAPGDHHLPVLARVRVSNRGKKRGRDGRLRIVQQRSVQFALRAAGLRRRHQLRARQIGLQEFVGEEQVAASVAVEQMVTAGEPEIARRAHLATPLLSPVRSKCSTGPSSSPTISKNSKARACPTPWRGRKVRNTSRIAPFSWLRVTATSTPGG